MPHIYGKKTWYNLGYSMGMINNLFIEQCAMFVMVLTF